MHDVADGLRGLIEKGRQLAELRKANLVKARREAKLVFYSLADDLTILCANSIETVFGSPSASRQQDASTPAAQTQNGSATFARVIR